MIDLVKFIWNDEIKNVDAILKPIAFLFVMMIVFALLMAHKIVLFIDWIKNEQN